MLLPIGSERGTDSIPWMTIALIATCAIVHWLAPKEKEILPKILKYCESPLGVATTDALKEAGLKLGTPREKCTTAVMMIVAREAQPIVEKSKLNAKDKKNLARLIRKTEAQLDFYDGAFDPKRFSFVDLIGSGFYHADWFHLIGNMLFLWLFGRVLEESIGSLGVLAVFLSANAFANLAYMLIVWLGLISGLPTLGASAGIYGIMAGVWRQTPTLKFRVLYWFVILLGTFRVRATILIGVFVLSDIFSLVTNGLSGVNLIGHLAGFWFIFTLLDQQLSHYEVTPARSSART